MCISLARWAQETPLISILIPLHVPLPGSGGVIFACVCVFQADFHRGHPEEQVPGAGLQVPLQRPDAGADAAGQRPDRPARAAVRAHGQQESVPEPRWR